MYVIRLIYDNTEMLKLVMSIEKRRITLQYRKIPNWLDNFLIFIFLNYNYYDTIIKKIYFWGNTYGKITGKVLKAILIKIIAQIKRVKVNSRLKIA